VAFFSTSPELSKSKIAANKSWKCKKYALYLSPFVMMDANLCRNVLHHWQTSHLLKAAAIIKIINLLIIIIIVINVAGYLKD